MPEIDFMILLSQVVNWIILTVLIVVGSLVGRDARKIGLSWAEALAWALLTFFRLACGSGTVFSLAAGQPPEAWSARCKMMKRLVVLCTAVLATILLIVSGCQTSGENAPPVYTGLTISGELPGGWQKTTLADLNRLLNAQLPVPTYLPAAYDAKEVYYYQEPNSNPQVTEVLLLISEQQIQWVGNKYTCRLALALGWNEAGLGLKMPWAEYIPEVRGRLENKDGEYILWWESYGSPKSLGSTSRLHASSQLSKQELIKIAASTPSATLAPAAIALPYPGDHGITTTKIESQPSESGMLVNSLMVKLTIGDLVRQSDAILIGKVVDIFPSRETEGPFGKMIVTDVLVEAERYLFSRSQSAYVGVQVWGGRLADKAMWVEDQPVFNLGEEAALFLASIPDSSVPPEGIKSADYYIVTGSMQGKLGYKNGTMITLEGKSINVSEVEQKIASKQGDSRK